MAKKERFKDWVLFEDENYLVLNKPSGISCLKERGNPLLESILQTARKTYPNITLCHRLDKYTSGILLLAKTEEAMRNASIQFERKKIKKIYHAFIENAPELNNEIVDLPILIDDRNRKVKISKNYGKKSKTIFTTIEKYKDYSLIQCELESGRMHQIRVHISHLGYPIVADTLYGGSEIYLSDIKHKFNYNRTGEEQPLIKRFALHAFQLGFADLEGKWVDFEAPYPKDLNVLYKMLRKHNKRD